MPRDGFSTTHWPSKPHSVPGREKRFWHLGARSEAPNPQHLERASRRGPFHLPIPRKHNAFSQMRKKTRPRCRLGPPLQGPAGAASPSGATAGFAESRSTPARAWQPRRQLPPGSRATRCCRENVRPGKHECEERSREDRGSARFVRPEHPGCGAGSRAGASRPTRGSGLLTRRGLDALSEVKPPDLPGRNQAGCHAIPVHVHTHVAPRRRMPCQRLAWNPRGSSTALPPIGKPEAELASANRPLSRRENAWPWRGWRKPKGGCLPGLRSGAVLEGGPRPRPQRSTSQGRRKRLLPRP